MIFMKFLQTFYQMFISNFVSSKNPLDILKLFYSPKLRSEITFFKLSIQQNFKMISQTTLRNTELNRH